MHPQMLLATADAIMSERLSDAEQQRQARRGGRRWSRSRRGGAPRPAPVPPVRGPAGCEPATG